ACLRPHRSPPPPRQSRHLKKALQRMTIRKSSRALLSTVFAALALTWGIGSPAAEEAEPNACRIAIRAAEVRYDLPSDLLLAMGMVESGLNPFAINIAGRPAQPD